MDQNVKVHGAMAQLISEIEAYVALRGGKPGTVLQRAGGLGGQVWGNWCSGRASCTLPMADRIRRYMADNWPEDHAMPFTRPADLPTPNEDAA